MRRPCRQLLKSTADAQAQEMTRYERGLKLNPARPHRHARRGNALRDGRQLPRGRSPACADSIRSPQHPEAYYHIARLALVRGDRHAALAAAKKAVALQPDDPGVANLLGRALHRSNKNKEAVAALQRAIALDPDNGLHHYHLAKVYEALGQHEDAKVEIALSTAQLAAPAWDMVQEDIEEIEIPLQTAAPHVEMLPAESALLPPAPDEVMTVQQASVPSISVPSRTAESIKEAVCNAFTTAPSACSQNLSTTALTAGFGGSAGTSTGASC